MQNTQYLLKMEEKPLHNFDLPNPNLKWKIGGSSTKNRRKVRSPSPLTSPYPPPIPHPEHVPKVVFEEEGELEGTDLPLDKYYNKNGDMIGMVDTEKIEKKSEEGVRGEGGDEVNRSRLVIKLPGCKNVESIKGKGVVRRVDKKKCGEKNVVEKRGKEVMVDSNEEDVKGKGKERVRMKVEKEKVTDSIDSLDGAVKSWNLRSKTNKSSLNSNIGGLNGSRTQPLKGKEADIWERLNINIALTQREIDEDLYAMGVKSTRKIKRRAKSVQTIIDEISPGNNLKNISVDTYDVSANSVKKQE